MKRAATITTLLLLVGSSLAGVIGLGVASLETGQRTILSLLQFQLNGRDPYTVKMPMSQGERISGEVNSTGGTATFPIVLQGVVMQSESVSGSYRYQFTARSAGIHELVFQSTEPAVVSVGVYSS